MFDQLDDTEAFTPGPGFRAAAKRRGRSRRRRTWLARSGLVVAVAVVGGVAASAALVDRRLDDVDRVEVAGLAEDPAAPAEPYTVLFVGDDTADGLAADDPVMAGRGGVEGARSDTVVLARVEPAEDRITVLPLPRDLWVDGPGMTPRRLNAVYAAGGPAELVATVRSEFGVEVNHYVQVGFGGAVDIGDAIGLRLAFPRAVRDGSTGLSLAAGCQTLDGRQVLALARSRHLQAQAAGGRWELDPTGDLGRIERQQAIGLAVLASLSHVDATDPGQLADLLDVVSQRLTVDRSVGNDELVQLFRDLAGSEVVQLRLPVVDAVRDGAQVLDQAAGADAVAAQFRTGRGPGDAGSTTSAPVTDPGVPRPSVSPAGTPTLC